MILTPHPVPSHSLSTWRSSARVHISPCLLHNRMSLQPIMPCTWHCRVSCTVLLPPLLAAVSACWRDAVRCAQGGARQAGPAHCEGSGAEHAERHTAAARAAHHPQRHQARQFCHRPAERCSWQRCAACSCGVAGASSLLLCWLQLCCTLPLVRLYIISPMCCVRHRCWCRVTRLTRPLLQCVLRFVAAHRFWAGAPLHRRGRQPPAAAQRCVLPRQHHLCLCACAQGRGLEQAR